MIMMVVMMILLRFCNGKTVVLLMRIVDGRDGMKVMMFTVVKVDMDHCRLQLSVYQPSFERYTSRTRSPS